MEEEKPVKKSNNLVIILLVIAIIFGVGGFFLGKSMNSNISNNKNNNENKEENKKDKEISKNDTIPSSNYYHTYPEYVNSDGKKYIYHFSNDSMFANLGNDMGITIVESNDKKAIDLKFDKKIYNYYGLEVGEEYSGKIEFDEEIKQIVVGTFGQGTGEERIFILLSDGTVEFVYPYNIIKEKKEITSKKIANIDSAVSLNLMEVETEPSWYYSVGVLRSDDTIYDLIEFIQKLI